MGDIFNSFYEAKLLFIKTVKYNIRKNNRYHLQTSMQIFCTKQSKLNSTIYKNINILWPTVFILGIRGWLQNSTNHIDSFQRTILTTIQPTVLTN
jgi:predicted phosphohydrolase